MKSIRLNIVLVILIGFGLLGWNLWIQGQYFSIQKEYKHLQRILQYQKGANEVVQYDLGVAQDSVRVLQLHIGRYKDSLGVLRENSSKL